MASLNASQWKAVGLPTMIAGTAFLEQCPEVREFIALKHFEFLCLVRNEISKYDVKSFMVEFKREKLEASRLKMREMELEREKQTKMKEEEEMQQRIANEFQQQQELKRQLARELAMNHFIQSPVMSVNSLLCSSPIEVKFNVSVKSEEDEELCQLTYEEKVDRLKRRYSDYLPIFDHDILGKLRNLEKLFCEVIKKVSKNVVSHWHQRLSNFKMRIERDFRDLGRIIASMENYIGSN
jgi:hypothetical protein